MNARAVAALAAVRARTHDAAGPPPTVPEAAAVLAGAVLTVHLHPDRPARDGRTAARGLADDGVYRTQFETGTSSGGLDEVLGGGRSRWEHALFDGAYDDAEPADRPRYGGLDLLPYPDGACPRFGSTHLRLRRETLSRCTFAWGDSVTDPSVLRTWDQVVDVLAAAAADAAPEMRGEARTGADRLDPYVEAHVHGGLRMSDVEAVVTDPSYRDTPVWEDLSCACSRSGSTLRTHAGYALAADAVDPTFRTPRTADLARAVRDIAGDPLTPAALGAAGRAVVRGEAGWARFGDRVAALQELKHLWHHLAAFGYRG